MNEIINLKKILMSSLLSVTILFSVEGVAHASSNTWQQGVTSLPKPISTHSSAVVGDDIYVIGGMKRED